MKEFFEKAIIKIDFNGNGLVILFVVYVIISIIEGFIQAAIKTL